MQAEGSAERTEHCGHAMGTAICVDPVVTLTLELDTRCAATPPSSVRIVGPWWNGWDPNAGPVATDDNSDGIWTVVFETAPDADMEYLWSLDGEYEALVGAGACAPITDGATYANRQWVVGSGDRVDVANSCDACTP
jgi:hypothetical protein